MRAAAAWLCISLLAGVAGCDYIGDPWVTDPEQYAEERARSEALRNQLIDRAERGQQDR